MFRCVLSDFGEAKELDSNNTSVGTPYYVAPEIFSGNGDYNLQCDVYSFGVLLGVALNFGSVSEFFFWDRPRNLSGYIVSQRILSGWRPKPKPMFKTHCPTIVRLIQRCMMGVPSDRPTMKDVVRALKEWKGDGKIEVCTEDFIRAALADAR